MSAIPFLKSLSGLNAVNSNYYSTTDRHIIYPDVGNIHHLDFGEHFVKRNTSFLFAGEAIDKGYFVTVHWFVNTICLHNSDVTIPGAVFSM